MNPEVAPVKSGVPWIGRIPPHWTIESGKYRLRATKVIAGTQHPFYERLSLTMNGVLPRSKEDANGLSPDSFATYQILRPGQLVFKLIDLENRATSRVGISDDLGLVSSAYIVASTIRGWNARYAFYFYTALYLEGIFNVLGSGVRSTLNSDDLRSLSVPVPPSAEQAEIVDFLDRETAEIDAFIADQEQLIELLTERRAATISHAVTKGLDPTAPMKHVESDSLDVIPEHWILTSVRRLVPRAESGTSVNGHQSPAGPEELGVLRTGSASKGYFDASQNKRVADGDLDRVSTPVRQGWVLINRANSPELVGSGALIRAAVPNLYLSDKLWQIDFAKADNAFVYYWTLSIHYRSQIQLLTVGASASMQNLSFADFLQLRIAAPGVTEQSEIAEHLDAVVVEFDATIADAREAIVLSRERRAALISAAVTGKIDVRDHGVA